MMRFDRIGDRRLEEAPLEYSSARPGRRRSPLPSGRLPAPPHNQGAHGRTWHHPDDVLFRIVKEGTAAIVGGGYESDMPGFADVLSDPEMRAVLDSIKSTWPERERSYQERVSQES